MKRVFCLFLSMVILTVSLVHLKNYRNEGILPAKEENMPAEENLSSETENPPNKITVDILDEKEDNAILVSKSDDTSYGEKLPNGDSMQQLLEKQDDHYAYTTLDDAGKELYMEILCALTEFKKDVRLSCVDNDEISRVFQCVLNDHPEIFYVNGYTYTQHTLGDIVKKITFTGNYTMSEKEVEERQRQIDNYVNQCFSGLSPQADEYETVKYVYEYIINNTEYSDSSANNQNICSVFLDGRSVCQGYAKATQYLLQKAGIKAELVLGEVSTGEGHAWDLVSIDNEWYYVDTTWGDASYQAVGKGGSYSEDKIPTINYDYLCVTTKQLNRTHTIDNVVEMPQCISDSANYYVREGLYLYSIDEEQLKKIFRDGYDKGSAYVTLKCDSEEIYNNLYERLITGQEIFRYLDSDDKVVSYTENAGQYSMSFWLV